MAIRGKEASRWPAYCLIELPNFRVPNDQNQTTTEAILDRLNLGPIFPIGRLGNGQGLEELVHKPHIITR